MGYSGSIGLLHEMTAKENILTDFTRVATGKLVMAGFFTVGAFNFVVFRYLCIVVVQILKSIVFVDKLGQRLFVLV